MFYWHYQHTSQITQCINNLKIHFSLRRETIKNSNSTFVCYIFLSKRKWKKKIVLHLLNYIFTFHFINLHTIFVHPNFTFFSFEPTTKPSSFWKFILVIIDNITCSSHPHRNKDRIMRLHIKQNLYCWDL